MRILEDKKRIEVRIACREDTVWIDPATRQQTHIRGWRERQWRHLDTCEFETVVLASLPCLKLPSGKTMSVSVPWADPGGRFTKRMEGHLVDVLLCCPEHRRAALLAGITVDDADGVMVRAVEHGLARRKTEPVKSLGIDEKAIRKRHHPHRHRGRARPRGGRGAHDGGGRRTPARPSRRREVRH